MIEKILENLAGQYGIIGIVTGYLLYNDYLDKKHKRDVIEKSIEKVERKVDTLDEKVDKHILEEHHSKKEG
ncbi:hypothetical protein [Cetobacterium sp.]|uniref:hypothetical protein n=1 Tax=Cetobacterium sp. TaxID=2071632 RepID=UPI003F35845A